MRRSGFTVVEIVVATVLTLAVFAITIPFVRSQTRALGKTAGRIDADQVARYAMRAIEQDLRVAAGEYGQPTLVAAGPMMIAFNANLRQADSLDASAMEEEVVGGAAGAAWPVARAALLPTTSVSYPTSDYVNADGDTSLAETTTYFVLEDTTSGHADVYALFRQANDQTPVQLVTGLYLPSGQKFFSYFSVDSSVLTEVDADSLLFWDDSLMSEIRTIGLKASGLYVNPLDSSEFIRTIETRVTLPVRARVSTSGCSAAPSAPGAGLSATASASGPRSVNLAWNKSAEDTGSPSGALGYIVERRVDTAEWTVVATVNAVGASTYTWSDPVTVVSGSVQYRVSTSGCGGQVSATAVLGTVTL
jgi:hypothetical protein